jgi:hypothetical protein
VPAAICSRRIRASCRYTGFEAIRVDRHGADCRNSHSPGAMRP